MRPRTTARSTRAMPRPGSARARRCSTPPRSSPRRRNRMQLRHFGGLELAPSAGLEAFERQRAVAAAMETLDVVADRFEHPPHLAVSSLMDGQLDATRPEPAHAGRRGGPVVEPDATP